MLQIWNMKLLHLPGDFCISVMITLPQYISSAFILPVKTLSNSQNNTKKGNENTKCITCNFPLGKKRTGEGMCVSDSKLLLDSKYLFITLLGWHTVKNIVTFFFNSYYFLLRKQEQISTQSLCKNISCPLCDHVDYDTNPLSLDFF